MRTCFVDDTLAEVIDVIVKAEVHRLIIVDKEQRVAGIISLSDILRHLVLEPPGTDENTTSSAAIGVIFKTADSSASMEGKSTF